MKKETLLLILILLFPIFPISFTGCYEKKGDGLKDGEVFMTISFGKVAPQKYPNDIPQIKDKDAVKWIFRNISISSGDTVYSILIKTAEKYNFTVDIKRYNYGIFVEGISGVEGGGDYWWTYYVNGVFGETAANMKEVGDRDEILWIYSSSNS